MKNKRISTEVYVLKGNHNVKEIIQNNREDFVYLGRKLLRNPNWPLDAAKELGYEIIWPFQYERSKK